MNITEQKPGIFVSVLQAPIVPADLAALAAQLPADVFLTDSERDGDDRLSDMGAARGHLG
ncbi:hypothetical protein ACQPYA_11030 [Micromonospora sp. CA-263727]|uniref:hypothetical protein n=1 Tax=Micromonospora sp. CA-263727 TaxID=3239967 RepID=UPI003D8BA771